MKENGIREYSPGDITLWLLSLEEMEETDFIRMYDCCSKERRQAADRIKSEQKRKQSVGAGYLLFLLKKRFSIVEEPIILSGGKPVFPGNGGVHFNISHSGGYVVLAFGKAPLGVDIEYVKRADLKVAKRFFTREEYDRLAEMPETEREEIFYKIWTGKEAVIKASGAGLSVPLDSFSVMDELVECRGMKYELYRQRIAENDQILWVSAARRVMI